MGGYFSSSDKGFSALFPEVEALELEISVRTGITKADECSFHTYSLKDPPPASIPCQKPGCSGGSFEIRKVIQLAVASRKTEIDQSMMCRGQEPAGASQFRSCAGCCQVTGTLKLEAT